MGVYWKSTLLSPRRSTPLPLRFAPEHSSLFHHPLVMILTLNPQFVTVIETGSVFLLLAHLQRLQHITVYTSQEGEEHTSHNELHELNTTPASNTQLTQRRTATHSEVTLLPAHRALPNRDGLDVGMILTLEHAHVGEGEGGAAEGREVREGGEIEFGAALHSGVHIDLLHGVRETVLMRGVGEVIGGGENELLQCGSVYDSYSFNTSTFRCDGMNPSKGTRNANLEVIRDVCNSTHSLSLTLQCNHVRVLELSNPTSTNATKRRQIDHGECVGERAWFLSREQGSFITEPLKSIWMKEEISEGREI
mgnify:CR=1 FL=1